MKKLIIIAALALGVAVSQTNSPKAYVWVLNNGTFRLTEITGLVNNGSGYTVPSSKTYSFGAGFITAEQVGTNQVQVSIDTAYVLYRGAAPTAPGPCAVTSNGTGVLAFDAGYAYVCIQNPASPGTFRWGRAPL